MHKNLLNFESSYNKIVTNILGVYVKRKYVLSFVLSASPISILLVVRSGELYRLSKPKCLTETYITRRNITMRNSNTGNEMYDVQFLNLSKIVMSRQYVRFFEWKSSCYCLMLSDIPLFSITLLPFKMK